MADGWQQAGRDFTCASVGSAVLARGREKSDKVLQLLLLPGYGCDTPPDSALGVKKCFYAFIFRIAILISPLKVIFFPYDLTAPSTVGALGDIYSPVFF